VYTDVTKEQDIVSLMQNIFDPIHILINKAGKFQHKSFDDVTWMNGMI